MTVRIVNPYSSTLSLDEKYDIYENFLSWNGGILPMTDENAHSYVENGLPEHYHPKASEILDFIMNEMRAGFDQLYIQFQEAQLAD